MNSKNVNFCNKKTIHIYKIFITDKNSVYINGINEYGFSYEFIKNNDLKIYNKFSVKEIIFIKKYMDINELYIEIGDCGINKFISLESENKIKNEYDLDINIFTIKLISKIYNKENEVTINELLEFLKTNNNMQALKIIQYIKLNKILNDFDVYKLYVLYSNYLKETSSKFIENNIFYIERSVLGLSNLEKINIIL